MRKRRVAVCILLAALTATLGCNQTAPTSSSKQESGKSADGATTSGKLPLYPLSPAAIEAIEGLASKNDVLVLGEIHGTQEVPAVVATLLGPLTKVGYNVLALEIPKDEQAQLNDWATGKTEKAPDFFARPSDDGRGNIQLLALIRLAVSSPFQWRIICFDYSKSDAEQENEKISAILKRHSDKALDPTPALEAASNSLWLQRDAAMAAAFADQYQHLAASTRPKVLAICGNMHARVANRSKEPELKQLWPSFAALVQRDNPKLHIVAVNVELHGGGFFNNGKINEVRGRPMDKAEMRSAPESDWDWVLDLPHATPATFLAPPRSMP